MFFDLIVFIGHRVLSPKDLSGRSFQRLLYGVFHSLVDLLLFFLDWVLLLLLAELVHEQHAPDFFRGVSDVGVAEHASSVHYLPLGLAVALPGVR